MSNVVDQLTERTTGEFAAVNESRRPVRSVATWCVMGPLYVISVTVTVVVPLWEITSDHNPRIGEHRPHTHTLQVRQQPASIGQYRILGSKW